MTTNLNVLNRFFESNCPKEPIRGDESDFPLQTGCCHETYAVSVSVCATIDFGAVFKTDRGWRGEICRNYLVPVFSHKSKNGIGFILSGKLSTTDIVIMSVFKWDSWWWSYPTCIFRKILLIGAQKINAVKRVRCIEDLYTVCFILWAKLHIPVS